MDIPLQGISSYISSLMMSPEFKFISPHVPNFQFLPENLEPYIIISIFYV